MNGPGPVPGEDGTLDIGDSFHQFGILAERIKEDNLTFTLEYTAHGEWAALLIPRSGEVRVGMGRYPTEAVYRLLSKFPSTEEP